MPSDTPFRIWRPSTLARRSLISKSANLLFLLLHHVSAVIVRFSHPGRSSHVGSEKPLIHLLLVDARQPGAGGDVLDGAVAVADRQPASPEPSRTSRWRSAPCLETSRWAAISASVAGPCVFRKARITSRLESMPPV